MYLAFEILFYLGLVTIGCGLLWSLVSLVRRRWSGMRWAALLVLVGVACIATPFIYTRTQIVDLGPQIRLVQGEKHITLTGWDQESYASLEAHPETIVLQMANQDVTDQTLTHLRGMANLRELDLNDSQVSDDGLAELSKLTALKRLRLRGTRITDRGMGYLSRLPELKQLDLRQTLISDDAVEQWEAAGEGRRAIQ